MEDKKRKIKIEITGINHKCCFGYQTKNIIKLMHHWTAKFAKISTEKYRPHPRNPVLLFPLLLKATAIVAKQGGRNV